MRRTLAVTLLGLAAFGLATGGAPQNGPVTIRVNTNVTLGPMYPFWAWFGHETSPTTRTTPNGLKLLSRCGTSAPFRCSCASTTC